MQQPPRAPRLRLPDGRELRLEGDADSMKVLEDARLAGSDMEAEGRLLAGGRFEVNPRYTNALWVYRDGKKWMITYWCEVCAIRTYTPGKCQCCQEETALDLRPPGQF